MEGILQLILNIFFAIAIGGIIFAISKAATLSALKEFYGANSMIDSPVKNKTTD